jgi:hypothetical protein
MDCWDVVLSHTDGAKHESLAHYSLSDRPIMADIADMLCVGGDWAHVHGQLEDGDVVLMGTSLRYGHAGIVQDGRVLHWCRRLGVVSQSLSVIRQSYSHTRAYRWVG